MKIASYILDGAPAYGVAKDDGFVTVSKQLKARYADLRAVLAAGALDEIRRAADGAQPDVKQSAVKFLPVIANPDKVMCVGLNYKSHAAELGRTLPNKPQVFARWNNTLIGHEQPMIRPKVSSDFDYEGELAVILGRGGRHIPVERAMEHVAGYTCFNDATLRDYLRLYSQTSGKNFFTTGPLGPWMVTTDELPDPTQLTLQTRLNGVTVQNGKTNELIYSVAETINFLSEITPLEAGDVIATGTPSGVGVMRKPPLWMKGGDTIEVEISGIGVLRNKIVDEK